MEIELVLQIQSTGQELKREVTDKNANRWEGYWCRRLLRYKRTNPEVKAAIERGDVITGWSNFDQLQRDGATGQQLAEICDYLFTTYPER